MLIVTHLGAATFAWAVTDKRPIDTEVVHVGYFQVDTSRILSTTVQSLREENKLLVFSYKSSARVVADRTRFYLFGAHQVLIVPASVNYYVDLSRLTLADVAYDEKAKLVRVTLPALVIGDPAFSPEGATTINGGLLSFSDGQVEDLRKINYAAARRAVVAQSQQQGLINAAQRQAQTNVASLFEIPLRIAGQPDVKVVATFQ